MRQLARTFGRRACLPMAMGAAALVAGLAACSDIRPEPDAQQEGMLESPTHEADAFHRAEERQRQNRGGGGGSY